MGVALPQELLDRDGVADGLPGGGQVAVEFDGRVEQAVGAAAAHDEVDPEPGREEEVGLAGLDRDAHRRPAAVEVPRVGQDVVLGDDASGPEAAFVPVDLQDAVDQHERLVRQPDARGEGVHLRERRAQHLGGRPARELEALGTVIGRRRRQGRFQRGQAVPAALEQLPLHVERPGAGARQLGRDIQEGRVRPGRGFGSGCEPGRGRAEPGDRRRRRRYGALAGCGGQLGRGRREAQRSAGARHADTGARLGRLRAVGGSFRHGGRALEYRAVRATVGRVGPGQRKAYLGRRVLQPERGRHDGREPPGCPAVPGQRPQVVARRPGTVPQAVGDADAYRGFFQPGFGQRRRHCACGAVEAGRAQAAQDRVDGVAVGLGTVEPLQHQRHRPVGRGHRWPVRDEALLQERAAQVAAEIDGADQRAVHLTAPDGARGDLEGREAGGGRGGGDEARSSQAEFARDAAGHHAAERAENAGGGERRRAGVHGPSEPAIDGRGVRVGEARAHPAGEGLREMPAQVEIGRAEVEVDPDHRPHARPVRPQRELGSLHGLGRHLQHEQVLGQNVGDLDRRDAEAGGVEGHRVDVGAAEGRQARQEPVAGFPAVGGPGPDQGAAFLERCRESSQAVGRAETDGHARDGDRVFAHRGAGIRSGRQRQRQLGLRRPRASPATGRPPLGRPLLEQEVGVDAAEAEGAHRRAARPPVAAFPLGRLGQDPQRVLCEGAAVRGR